MSANVIRFLRGVSILSLFLASVYRMEIFGYYSIGLSLMLLLPYLSIALASCFVVSKWYTAIFLIAMTGGVVASGAYLDYCHFARASKDGVFDGVYYLAHGCASLLGALALVALQPHDFNAKHTQSA